MRNLRSSQLKQKMKPKKGSPQVWKVPSIVSVSALANWFEINERMLYWLASLGPSSTPGKHYQTKWVRKRVGYRLLESPKTNLKAVQRKINSELLSHVPVSISSHGFCTGRNVKSYVEMHSGKNVCLKMDLRSFFPSISSNRIYGLFKCLGYPKEVSRILTGLTTTITDPPALSRLSMLSTGGQELYRIHALRHLPQGAPTSPTLSNLIAFRLDCRLEELTKRGMHGKYSRYADDLLFSFDDTFRKDRQAKNRLRRFSQKVAVIAMEEGFDVNFRKTRLMFRSQRQHATGLVFNEKPNCKREVFDRLKAILFNCVKHGPKSQNLDSHPDFRAHLMGRIEWINHVNPARGRKLLSLFETIEW